MVNKITPKNYKNEKTKNQTISPSVSPDKISSGPPKPPVPVKIYPNTDICKNQILLENKDKSGIYMWTNLLNKKQYVGSSENF